MSVIQECMQDNDNILQVENICKYYKAGSGRLFDKTVFKAVNQVSFSVKRGETFGLVGESGLRKKHSGEAGHEIIGSIGRQGFV